MSKIISRIAPTPSGFLHAGNALNFILTYLYTRAQNGFLHLRIDDYDAPRYRKEYVQNIFDVLEFLELSYDAGTRSVHEFESKFSFKHRIQNYYMALNKLGFENLGEGFSNKDVKIYACECTRTTLDAYKNGIYTQVCKSKNLAHKPYKTAIRFTPNLADKLGAKVAQELGDFIIWKKDDTPAYNFASVIDDELLGVNLVVRGDDLSKCSTAQIYLASVLGLNFANANIIHHELIKQDGIKLSKSVKSPAIDFKLGAKFYYQLVAKSQNLNEKCSDKLENLLYEFKLKIIH